MKRTGIGTVAAVVITCSFATSTSAAQASVADKVYSGLFSKHRKSAAEQKRNRANTAVMGIRGLDADAESGKKLQATANLRAVYRMEDRAPNEAIITAIRQSITHSTRTGSQQSTRISNTTPSLNELEAEVELGRKMAAQILGAYQAVDSEEVQNYVLALATVVAEGGLAVPRPFRVTVVRSPAVNAFACPGGYIFVTLGALKSVRNESELAALLGHEIVHVSNRHLLTSLKKKVSSKSLNKSKEEADDILAARQRVKPEASQDASNWAALLGPKGVSLTLLQASSEALETLFSKGLEQEFELEADSLGSQMSAVAGYQAFSLLNLFKGFVASTSENQLTKNSTHPPYQLRIETLEKFLTPFAAQREKESNSSQPFKTAQKLWTAL
jgi:predicted Zn-dependent protease